jgi:DNA-binding NarL/FixJ family response regulator
LETSPAGTTFSVYFPHLKAPLARLSDEAPASRSVVLLVDDDPAVLQYSGDALRSFGYRVLGASGVEQCLRRLEMLTPDLVILDLHLGDGSGAELLERLNFPGGPRVLIYSSFLTNDECRRLSALGARRFAYKPLGAHALINAVREALDDATPVAERGAEKVENVN